MSIDIQISNYEDYLYSYVDGELNAEESAALERFVAEHPQVRQELDLLLAARLQPDEEMVFDNKAMLYRGGEIHLQNYEGYLLSYVDGELNAEESAALEQFMVQHPKVREELVIWQATRLYPDPALKFENKSVLYRHSGTRVVRLRKTYWWAAAAMVAGLLAFLKFHDNHTGTIVEAPAVADRQTPPPRRETAQPKVADVQPRQDVPQPAAAPVIKKTAAPVLARNTGKVNTPAPASDPTPVDLSGLQTEIASETAVDKAIVAELSRKAEPGNVSGQTPTANIRSSIEVKDHPALATAAPAAEPGELIMSVTGNGLESKVLDKVTNVARFFAKKKNK